MLLVFTSPKSSKDLSASPAAAGRLILGRRGPAPGRGSALPFAAGRRNALGGIQPWGWPPCWFLSRHLLSCRSLFRFPLFLGFRAKDLGVTPAGGGSSGGLLRRPAGIGPTQVPRVSWRPPSHNRRFANRPIFHLGLGLLLPIGLCSRFFQVNQTGLVAFFF